MSANRKKLLTFAMAATVVTGALTLKSLNRYNGSVTNVENSLDSINSDIDDIQKSQASILHLLDASDTISADMMNAKDILALDSIDYAAFNPAPADATKIKPIIPVQPR